MVQIIIAQIAQITVRFFRSQYPALAMMSEIKIQRLHSVNSELCSCSEELGRITTHITKFCLVTYCHGPVSYKTHWKKEYFSPISDVQTPALHTQSLTCQNLFQLSLLVLKSNIQVEMFLIFIILGFYVFPCTFKWKRKRVRGNKVEMSRQ